MKNKICALIRQTWYETAKKNLQPGERLRFYEMCLEYEFNDVLPDGDAPFAARLLFDMVRADIDADKEKTQARAERSRNNGRLGGRPNITTLNTDEQNPENPVGSKKPVYTNTSTHTRTLHNSETPQPPEGETEDTHMFFCVCLDFFERGCSDPIGEGEKFWNYYAAMGWKTKGGGEIVDRMALAKAWRLADCSRNAIRARAPYADLMHKARPTEIELLRNFVSMTRNATTETVEIVFQERSSAILLDQKYMPALRQWIPLREDGKPYGLSYKALHATLD